MGYAAGIVLGMTPDEVKILRRRLNWTQRQLAAALNVTVGTVARWEQGARKVTPLVVTSLELLARRHGPSRARARASAARPTRAS